MTNFINFITIARIFLAPIILVFLIFGNYRRTNKIVEPQTLYFDDLTFVADKETLDEILD